MRRHLRWHALVLAVALPCGVAALGAAQAGCNPRRPPRPCSCRRALRVTEGSAKAALGPSAEGTGEAGGADVVLQVAVVGGGAVGLFFALLLASALPRRARVHVYEERWATGEGGKLHWEARSPPRVVTLQHDLWTDMPEDMQAHIFPDGGFVEQWPFREACDKEGCHPRSLQLADLEDRLLALAQGVDFQGTLDLRCGKYDRREHNNFLDGEGDGPGLRALVLADGEGAVAVRDALLLRAVGDAKDIADCTPQGVLCVAYDLDLVGPHTLNVADCTVLTMAQRRYFLAAGTSRQGSMYVLLRQEEVEAAEELEGSGLLALTQALLSTPVGDAPGAGVLAQAVQDGLRLFGVPQDAVRTVEFLRSRCLVRSSYHAELQDVQATGAEAKAKAKAKVEAGEPAPLHQRCCAFLLGGAADMVDPGPGRGVATAFRSAAVLADQLASTGRGLAAGWEALPTNFAEHTQSALLLIARDARTHVRRFPRRTRGASSSSPPYPASPASSSPSSGSSAGTSEAEDVAVVLGAVRAAHRRLVRAAGLPAARRAELSEADDLCARLRASRGLSAASAWAMRASGVWAADEFAFEAPPDPQPVLAAAPGVQALVTQVDNPSSGSDGDPVESAKAAYNRGVRLLKGKGAEKDPTAAAAAFLHAAKRGHREAQYAVGVMYLNGQGVDRDERQAALWFEEAAKQMHAKAQYNLGVMCENGVGVDRDIRKATAWTSLAAEQGHKKALRSGTLITFGGGPWMDYDPEEMGVAAIQREADAGNVHAQFRMGVMLFEGDHVPQDKGKASTWFMKAAQRGLAEGQYEMSRMLILGDGVEKDVDYGMRFLRSAAEQGHPLAQHDMGVMLYFGDGIGADRNLAAYWFMQAAKQEYPPSQNNIGWMLYLGDGVPQDTKEGRRWLTEAASRGNVEAQRHLNSISGYIVSE